MKRADVLAFLAGFATLALELAMPRALGPVFGTSVHTWTNVIAVVLLALALGQRLGGALARAPRGPALLADLLAAAGLLVVAVAAFSVRFGIAILPAPDALWPQTAAGHLVRGSLLSALALLALPMTFLGAVAPLLVRDYGRSGLGPGRATGRLLAVSTGGALLATFVTPHFAIPVLGVRGTMGGCAALLAIAALLVASDRRPRLLAVVTLLFVAWRSLSPSPDLWRPLVPPAGPGEAREVQVLSEADSPYQYVRVARWDVPLPGGARRDEIRLSLDEGVTEYHSVVVPGEALTGAYYDAFAILPALFPPERRLSIAVIGGGAGTMPRLFRAAFGERIESLANVELDPVVQREAERFGWRPGPKDRSVVADGRLFLKTIDERFDLVILDAYARQVAIPAHLATVEAFAEVQERLRPGGLFAINVSVPDLAAPLGLALLATLRQVFPAVAAVSVPGTWNVVLLAAVDRERDFRPGEVPDLLRTSRRSFLRGLVAHALPEGDRVLVDDQAPLERLARRP